LGEDGSPLTFLVNDLRLDHEDRVLAQELKSVPRMLDLGPLRGEHHGVLVIVKRGDGEHRPRDLRHHVVEDAAAAPIIKSIPDQPAPEALQELS